MKKIDFCAAGQQFSFYRREKIFSAKLKYQLQRPKYQGKLNLKFTRLERDGERVFGPPHTAEFQERYVFEDDGHEMIACIAL